MKDAAYLGTLQAYWKSHQTFPTMAKLREVMGLSSTSSVFALIGRLTDAGYIKRHEGRIVPAKAFFARPVLGPVRAGLPQPATQEEPALITLDDYLIDNPSRTSVHRVRRDSMKDAGIFDGDLVVVEHNSPTSVGDIVVAVVDGEFTVKTLRQTAEGRYYLEPANAVFEPIYPTSSLELLGVVISVVRRVRR